MNILRNKNFYRLLVLATFSGYFAFVVLSGRWALYIDNSFQWLSVVAIVLFGLMAIGHLAGGDDNEGMQDDVPEEEHTRVSTWSILIAAVPLFLGLVIPARPLGADAIGTRGVDTTFTSVSLSSAGSKSLTIVASERNVLDWARAIASSPEPSEFDGEEANVVGFVFRDSRFAENQFMVTRFTLSCCVADALAVGLVVNFEGGDDFALDTWVRIEGTFEETEFDGSIIPILYAESVTPVEQPAQPYLYQ
jgi:putative membrane protein